MCHHAIMPWGGQLHTYTHTHMHTCVGRGSFSLNTCHRPLTLTGEQPRAIVPWNVASGVDDLVQLVQHTLFLPRRDDHLQPPGFFSTAGLRFTSLEQLQTSLQGSKVALLYEGGQWLWPPIAVGHVWTVYANSFMVRLRLRLRLRLSRGARLDCLSQ